MMNIGIVRVRMLEPLMPVRMRVRLTRRVMWRVLVLVMYVVRVFVLVGHWFMDMKVFMSFCGV